MVLWEPLFARAARRSRRDHRHVMVPMRDGTKLSRTYFPRASSPGPCFYQQRTADLRPRHAKDVCASGRADTSSPHRTSAGHISLKAHGSAMRPSVGAKNAMVTIPSMASRSAMVVGKIGTFGGSQSGFAELPRRHATASPGLSVHDRYGLSLFHEGYRIGGTTRERFKQMESVCRNAEDNRRLLREWFAHPPMTPTGPKKTARDSSTR